MPWARRLNIISLRFLVCEIEIVNIPASQWGREAHGRSDRAGRARTPEADRRGSHRGFRVRELSDPGSPASACAALRARSPLVLPEDAVGAGPRCRGALAGISAEPPGSLGSPVKPQGGMVLSPDTLSFTHNARISTSGFRRKISLWGLRWLLRGWVALSGNVGASSPSGASLDSREAGDGQISSCRSLSPGDAE